MKSNDRSRRDLLLILLLVPLGMVCMFLTGQIAIRLTPVWELQADLRSLLNPSAEFFIDEEGLIEPVLTGIVDPLFQPELLLTPNSIVPTNVFVVVPPPPREETPVPTPAIITPVISPVPTATAGGPIVVPTPVDLVEANLAITKTDNSNTYTPGNPINYTITVTNLGPEEAFRFDIKDNIPAVISGLTVSCTPVVRCGTNASSGNTISFTGASLYAGAGTQNQLTITVSGQVASGAVGNLSNTARIIRPAGAEYFDPDTSNNVATDTDTRFAISDLAITKTKSDGSNTYTAGSITYTVVVTNSSGPSDALGVRVVDNKPAQIASWSWVCANEINASGCTGVTDSVSNFTNPGLDIHVGGRIEYTVTAIPAGTPPNPQNISNSASILLPGSPSFIDPDTSNNTATDTSIPYIDLQITKDDGGAAFAPGGTVPYTVTVTNNSTFNLTGITVSDPVPARIATWGWCVAPCTPDPAASNADFADTINLAAGGSLTYTVGTIVSGDTTPGNITNTATVSAPAGLVDAVPGNDTATETTPPSIDLSITKTDGVATYTPGGNLTYTVTVTNNSGFTLNGVTVTDNMPALISSWTWTCAPPPGPPGATCATAAGTDNINTTVDLPAGTFVNFAITATVNTAAIGALENTATVSPPTGFVDAVPGNNSATDSDTNSNGEPDVGLPDGTWISIPEGSSRIFVFSPGIVADGDPGTPDFVYYERSANPSSVELDWVQIEISSDGSTWYQVFYWGDSNPGVPDTNSNMDYVNLINDLCTFEEDNCSIPLNRMYNNTGVTIDIDGIVPQASYSWIRITSPVSPNGDGSEIDAVQPYYP
jgi:uncharacterized repeat protein (TIGR01451 family)